MFLTQSTSSFRIKCAVLVIFLLAQMPVFAQQTSPAPPQSQSILIMNATAHLGNGQTIANAAVGFDNGKFTLVADATLIRIDLTKYGQVIEGTGKHLWPAMIALNTQLGLVEVEAARATLDFEETGTLNPNARAIIAYNADSEVPPTVRSNGVLLAQICPSGGRISGQSSVVQLDAWNWEDAAVKSDEGIHLNWPQMQSWSGWETGNPQLKKNEEYDKQIQALNQLFGEAKAWIAKPGSEVKNQRFESMRGLFDGSKKLYLHAETAKSIEESVVFAQKWGCKPVIVGGAESWLVTDFLKKNNVPIVLGKTHDLPMHDDSDIDQNYKTPAILAKAGLEFAISHDASWRVRNLAFQAGQAVAFGLDKEAALTAITLAPAKILGISDRVGSIESGKNATFFITSGDLLDMRTSKVERAFIDGRDIDLQNRQTRLFSKFEIKSKSGK